MRLLAPVNVVAVVVAVVAAAAAAAPAAAAAKGRKLAEDLKKQGDAAAAVGDAAKALAAYEQAITADPTYLPTYDAAAPLWFEARQFDVAIARLGAALAGDPRYAMGWYNLAFAHRKKGEHAPAIAAYQKFIELRPAEPDPYFGMGLTYKAMGEREKARAAFTKYVELEKRADKQRFVDKANAELVELGGPVGGGAGKAAPAAAPAAPAEPAGKPAAPVARPADASSPRARAEAARREGDKGRDAGDAKAAEKGYRAAIAADPTWAAPHNELGTLLFEQGRAGDAVAAFERAVALDARLELAWYNLAHARRKLGRHQDAVVAYRKYIELAPGNPDPFYGLGQSLLALGDKPAARAAFARYVELEKRPSEQKWIDKAKQEVAKLDAGQAPGAPAPPAPAAPAPAPVAVAPAPVAPAAPAGPRTPGVMTPMPAPSPAQLAEARRWIDKGDAAFAAHEYEQSVTHYRGAVAVDPTNVVARYRLGVTLAAQGDLAAALVAWEGVLLVDASHEQARRNIELARTKLARSDRKPATDEVLALQRARTLVDDGRWASAIALLDGLLAEPLHAQNAAALALRAEARLGGGDAAGAIVDWLGVLAVDPRFARAYRGLADSYAALGDAARAAYFRGLGTSLAN